MSTNVVPTRGELLDLFWRSVWTFISAAFGVPLGAEVIGLETTLMESMGLAGMIAVVNVVTVYARQKLGTLPPPTQVVIHQPPDASTTRP